LVLKLLKVRVKKKDITAETQVRRHKSEILLIVLYDLTGHIIYDALIILICN